MQPNPPLQADRSPDDAAAGTSSRRNGLALAGLLALAVAVRFVGLGHLSFSMDEISELRIAHGEIGDILSIGDGFPPLYHLILHTFVPLGDLSSRILSAVFGMGAVAVVWIWARQTLGQRVAYWTAGIMALAPLAVQASREGRAYGLLLLFAGLSVWALWRALDTPGTTAWVLWGVACAGGMYTHYIFAVVIGAEVIMLVSEPRPRPWRPILTGAAVLAVLVAPIAAFIAHDLTIQATTVNTVHIDPARMLYAGYSLVSGISLGPAVRDLHTMSALEALGASWFWLVLLVPSIGGLLIRGYSALDRLMRRRLLLLMGAGVVLSIVAIELTGLGLRVRYFTWLLIPLAAWLATGLAGLGPKLRWGVAGCLIGVAAFSIGAQHFDAAHQTEDARGVAAHLQATDALDDPVLVSGWYMARPISYYLDPVLALGLPDAWDRDLGRLAYAPDDGLPVVGIPLLVGESFDLGDAVQVVDTATRPGEPYRLLYSRPFDGDPEGELLATLQARDGLTLEMAFAGIDVYRGVRR